jgi:hypothetical protein
MAKIERRNVVMLKQSDFPMGQGYHESQVRTSVPPLAVVRVPLKREMRKIAEYLKIAQHALTGWQIKSQ